MVQSLVCLVMLLGTTGTGSADDKVSAEVKERQQNVARAARMYRIEVYESFRLDRDEYNRRREIGDKLQNSWDGSDQSSEQAELVTSWFEDSRELVFDEGKKAEFAAAPELPAKVVPAEEKSDKSLVSTEAPPVPPPAVIQETAPTQVEAPASAPGITQEATVPVETTPATTTSDAAVIGPSLLNALGKAIVEAASQEATEPVVDANAETAPIDSAELNVMPLERPATPAKVEGKAKQGAAKKQSAKKKTVKATSK